MATTDTNDMLSGTPAPATSDRDKVVSKTETATEKMPKSLSMLSGARSYGQALTQTEKKVAAIDEVSGGLRPPSMSDLPKMPEAKHTSPFQVWGSSAMLMMAIGSLMTRQHLTTAMNAGAAAIKAYQQGDVEQTNADFARWKVSYENALRQHDFQMELYKSAIGKLEKDKEQAWAELKTYAGMMHDSAMERIADQKSRYEAERLMLDHQKLNIQLQEAGPKIEESVALGNALSYLQKTQEWADADPIGKYRLLLQTAKKNAPSSWDPGNGSKEDLASAEHVYNMSYRNKTDRHNPPFVTWYKDQWPKIANDWASKKNASTKLTSSAGGSGQHEIRIKTQAEYDKLPSGSVFVWTDGKQYRKP